MVKRWEDFVTAFLTKILPLVSVLIGIAGGVNYLLPSQIGEGISFILNITTITLVVVILFAFYQIALTKDIKDILNERLPKEGLDPKNGEEEEREEERIETSGVGALGGMAVGGVLGLAGGPIGVIIGGIVGSLIGNQIEYESRRIERKKEEKGGKK